MLFTAILILYYNDQFFLSAGFISKLLKEIIYTLIYIYTLNTLTCYANL